ncbi:hypothetical protein KE335_gp59 [Aeromonas phage 2_D05]|uniref:Uncharacterized protein n=2 Tax=Kunmingvirus TaxID=2948791 RepID=A0A4Y5TWW1_9CAUD|nr:hypothetical protein KE335_gp59 [Aeromonas phage 2_D05]QDB73890.1 hypothetical protein 2D05_059 [Aeromonas phage 2_D05]
MGRKPPLLLKVMMMKAEKNVLTVEVKVTELPLVQELVDAMKADFDNLPDGVKAAVIAIMDKGKA